MEIKHVTKVTKPIPLVPRRLIKGVYERVDYQGGIVVPLDSQGVRDAVRELVEVRRASRRSQSACCFPG